ncbi:hypothetical protein [Butyrivibrio proteoclasticus]|nr:hypothetical protein [Butyrivibrio proteoclasticus]
MSRICPETGEKVVYLVCQECENKGKCSRKTRASSDNSMDGAIKKN